MDFLYDICGVRVRVDADRDHKYILHPLFRREALDSWDIEVSLVDGADGINVDGLDWFKDDGFCLVHCYEDERTVYELSYPAKDKLVCRMVVNRDYTKATVAYNRGALFSGWLSVMIQLLFRRYMIIQGGLILHSVSVLHDGGAVLFSGPSGMGKSTQADLWVKHRDSVIINGDRTTLSFRSGGLYASGSPWSGNSEIFTEITAPVKAVVFLEQAREDTVRRLDQQEVLQNMVPRSYLPYYSQKLMDKAFENMSNMLGCAPFFMLRNTATEESVRVLERALNTPS